MKKLLLLTMALSGCVHVSKSVIVDRSDQPVPMEEVNVVFDNDDVPDACERVAFMHANASEDFTDQRELADKFKKEAGKLGANTVYVQESYASSQASTSLFESGSDTEFDAEAFWCPSGGGVAQAEGG